MCNYCASYTRSLLDCFPQKSNRLGLCLELGCRATNRPCDFLTLGPPYNFYIIFFSILKCRPIYYMNFVRIISNFLVYFYLGPIFIFHIDIVYVFYCSPLYC